MQTEHTHHSQPQPDQSSAAPSSESTQKPEDIQADATLSADADGAPEAESHAPDAPPASEVAQLRQEIAELKDRQLRLYSEFENFRRRTAREKLELISTAGEKIMVELLPVLDDADRAEQAIARAETAEAAREAFRIINQRLSKVLGQQGLRMMEAKGTDFDPELHEAVAQIPASSEDLKGKVVDEVEKGYYLNDKLIRYAKVVTGA